MSEDDAARNSRRLSLRRLSLTGRLPGSTDRYHELRDERRRTSGDRRARCLQAPPRLGSYRRGTSHRREHGCPSAVSVAASSTPSAIVFLSSERAMSTIDLTTFWSVSLLTIASPARPRTRLPCRTANWSPSASRPRGGPWRERETKLLTAALSAKLEAESRSTPKSDSYAESRDRGGFGLQPP